MLVIWLLCDIYSTGSIITLQDLSRVQSRRRAALCSFNGRSMPRVKNATTLVKRIYARHETPHQHFLRLIQKMIPHYHVGGNVRHISHKLSCLLLL